MAERVEVKMIDDLTGEEDASPIEFGLDGVNYVIDLSEGNLAKLRELLADYISNGRKLGKSTASKASRLSSTKAGGARPKIDKEQSRGIREWARRHNVPVSDRGRLSVDVLLAYNAGKPEIAGGTAAVSDSVSVTTG